MASSSSTSSIPPPPTPDFLHDLLSQLQPPHLPISPHLLSTDLKTRHLYLPPSADQPDAYIRQRPDESAAASGSETYDALAHISTEWEAVEQQGGEYGGLLDRIGGTEGLWFTQVDEHTVLCRLNIEAPDHGELESRGPSVAVKLIHEGAAGWLLYDTERAGSSKRSPADLRVWSHSPADAHAEYAKAAHERAQRNPRPEELDDDDEDEAAAGSRWDGNGNAGDPRGGADDFWGGYSDDEKEEPAAGEPDSGRAPARGRTDDLSFTPNRARGETIKASERMPVVSGSTPDASAPSPVPPSHPSQSTYPSAPTAPTTAAPSSYTAPPLSRQTSSSLSDFGAGDTYWSAYAGVEDGLRASNPPSRIPSVRDLSAMGGGMGGMSGLAGMSRVNGEGEAYGGTGAETPVRWTPEGTPAEQREQEDQQGGSQIPPSAAAPKTETAAAFMPLADGETPPNANDRARPPGEAAKSLEATLRGLLALYAGEPSERSPAKTAEFWAVVDKLRRSQQ